MSTIFRVEKPGSERGLWYTTGKELQPLVTELGLACAALPMGYDPEYYRDSISWFSGCDNLGDLFRWFSPGEMRLLDQRGFKLVKFDSQLVRDYGGHQVFSKQHLLSSKEISLEELYKGKV